jgi:hypothetical protein
MAFPIDQQSAQSTNLMQQGNQFIKSNESAAPDDDSKNKSLYGQNGYEGPSSDLPGERTTSGFLPELEPTKEVVANYRKDHDFQTRKVSAEQYPVAHGMKPRVQPNIFAAPSRPVTKRGN